MKAVIIKERGKPALAEIKEPAMRPGCVKVKTAAVAINPSCDLAGTVEEVGSECTVDVKKGDRVFAVAHGANTSNIEDGAYAEYAMVRDGHLAKIPENMSFEEAATFGVGITTVAQSLYMTFKLPLPATPAEKPFPILIYGGSTATGTIAIQYAKLFVTTLPPHIQQAQKY
ncbi:zinc-binding oxidoreductase protein [Rutstroemia sp. NJR-2017a BBW]|nr:zinc-binding oxidoreductase protein [Rutstroemia sp. NJR-2017a BBW]